MEGKWEIPYITKLILLTTRLDYKLEMVGAEENQGVRKHTVEISMEQTNPVKSKHGRMPPSTRDKQ